MSLSCREARAALPGYGRETLERGLRQSLRDHMAACGDCREVAVHTDPGLLFAGTARMNSERETTDEDVAQILAGVRAGIAWRQAERKLTGGRPARRRRRAAATAAAVVALVLLVPATTSRRGQPRGVSNLAAPRVQAQAFNPVVPAARPVSSEVPASKFPADATIYDLSHGVGEPRVVWIVDRSLDI
ncbi:MAG TPA: zf-HC2 domain-containing protein [Thermoanaerobaculia bacterium]|nr:zf-HC2 domain-containing protein [Thermoanaerobaculia bacterium]